MPRATCGASSACAPDALLGVGVDRLDYTKGIEERLLRGRASCCAATRSSAAASPSLQLAAPSRTKIERYRELNERVEARRRAINDTWGVGTYRPIVLLRAHHEPPTVFRYYRAADLCYVSSLHDGMNLVAKEFVAARDDEQGVLVLSQFTGAARELTEALIVNPYDLDQASDALATALRMPPDEQRERMRSMRRLVSEFNVYRWAGRMLVDAAELRRKERITGRLSSMLTLRGAATRHEGPARPREPRAARPARLVERAARLRLRRHAGADRRRPPPGGDARPHRARCSPRVCERYPSAVISGRAKADVARRLHGRRVRYLVGNHGLEPGTRLGTFERQVVQAHPLLDSALDGVAGIDIEDKRYSLAVHYRRAREKPKARDAIRARRRRAAGADARHPRQAGDQRRARSGAAARATR